MLHITFFRKLAFYLLCAYLLSSQFLFGEIKPVTFQKLKVKDCLLPKDHPLQDCLGKLFENREIFQSSQRLSDAGFYLVGNIRRGFMVASHPSLGNYLIKKFDNSTPLRRQLNNYLRRIGGARALREFIKLNHLKHIVVPKKWLYKLPKQFSDPETNERNYVLIVEKINICCGGKDPNGEVARRYFQIDFDILRELCLVVFYFRGLDSGLQNMPFTYDNKIAFIDTEHWKNQVREGFLKHVMNFLNLDQQQYALKVFEELIKNRAQELEEKERQQQNEQDSQDINKRL